MPKTKKSKKPGKNIEKYRTLRKKFDKRLTAFRLKPETHTTARGVKIRIHGRGTEVSKPVTAVKGVVTKVYTPGSKSYRRIPEKYELTKELIEKGAPIIEPRIKHIEDKRGERIVWKEKDLGPSIKELLDEAVEKNKEEKCKRLARAYTRGTDKLYIISAKLGVRFSGVMLEHAYLTKKGEVIFSDLWPYKYR